MAAAAAALSRSVSTPSGAGADAAAAVVVALPPRHHTFVGERGGRSCPDMTTTAGNNDKGRWRPVSHARPRSPMQERQRMAGSGAAGGAVAAATAATAPALARVSDAAVGDAVRGEHASIHGGDFQFIVPVGP